MAGTEPQDWAERARSSFAAITADRLYSRRRKLFGERHLLLWRTYETLWPFANAWSAVGTLGSLAGEDRARSFLPGFLEGLASYHRHPAEALGGAGPVGFESVVVPPLGGGGDAYYDDNCWLGLALVLQHEQDRDERALSLAQRVFAFVVSGWSSDPSWSHPGGIRWKQPASNVSRNTCSNAPAAELGALLHRWSGDRSCLDWAVRIYDWVRAALLGPDQLYLDHISPDGTLNRDVWTYNQGTMIGAGVLLSEATGERSYLEQAEATAAAALGRFDLSALLDPNGPAFDAVLFRNLLLLDRTRPNPAYRSLAAGYGEEMWSTRRDPRTGLFAAGSSLNGSAPMIEVFALLAGAAPHA